MVMTKGNDWAKIVQEMQRSIDMTLFDMQHHLQETQEHFSRGQTDLKTILTTIEQGKNQLIASVDAGQDKIVQILMQIVHGKEAPNYCNIPSHP
jgi:hypothetical protein